MSANELSVETLLRAHAPRAPESLRVRVLALEPKRTPSRRLVLVIAVAVLGAVAAAIVHGLVSSSGEPAAQPRPFIRAAPAVGSGGALHAATPSIAGAGTRLQRTEAT